MYLVLLIIAVICLFQVDGGRVKSSLTLGDCTCGRNTGYDLSRYRNYNDILLHLDNLDLGDTASLLEKVRTTHNLVPVLTGSTSNRGRREQVAVYFYDSNHVITPQAVGEATKLKLAGVRVYVVVLDSSMNYDSVRQVVSYPASKHLLVLDRDRSNADNIERTLQEEIC